ncbi:MAG: hypothetical protein LCH95_16770 [Proteobacteria bacterium]|nr:hypothetical protein [Pseudomonadota bacterium]
MRPLPLCAVLLGLAPAFAQGQQQGQDPSQALCHAVAQSISGLMPSEVTEGRRASPLEVLDRASGGVVAIDRPAWPTESPAERLARLRDADKAPPDLLEAIGPLPARSVFRFGRSSQYLGRTSEGTAHCQSFTFFEARPGGPSRLLKGPEGVGLGEDAAFCFGSEGHAGEIDGVPAFIVQRDDQDAVELSVVPWRDLQWQKTCRVTLSFDNAFAATERFCKGVDCEQMAEQAQGLAKELDESLRQGPGLPDLSRLSAQARLDKRIPTFGEEPKSNDHAVYAEFQGDALFVPIVVADTMYLARIGRAGFAWRRSPNYLFAAYRMTGDHLEPVAGIYVDRVGSTLVDARVD